MFRTTLFIINKFLYMCENPPSSLQNEPPDADFVLLPLAGFPLSAEHNANGFPTAHRG